MQYNTGRKPHTIKVTLNSETPRKVTIIVRDKAKVKSIYAHREFTVSGKKDIEITMPFSPEVSEIVIYPTNGQIFAQGSLNADVVFNSGVKSKRMDSQIADFVKFAGEFAENMNYLEANNTIYISDCGCYRIDYVNNIPENPTTPMRISRVTGIIEVNRSIVQDYDVPNFMAIIFHEYSHFFRNKDVDNEEEADKHSLDIYLSLGFSKVECLDAWTYVFEMYDTNKNRNRYDLIEQIINKY